MPWVWSMSWLQVTSEEVFSCIDSSSLAGLFDPLAQWGGRVPKKKLAGYRWAHQPSRLLSIPWKNLPSIINQTSTFYCNSQALFYRKIIFLCPLLYSLAFSSIYILCSIYLYSIYFICQANSFREKKINQNGYWFSEVIKYIARTCGEYGFYHLSLLISLATGRCKNTTRILKLPHNVLFIII